jgi:methyl-accepting chemotaxis protein
MSTQPAIKKNGKSSAARPPIAGKSSAAGSSDYAVALLKELGRGTFDLHIEPEHASDPVVTAIAEVARSLNDMFGEFLIGSTAVDKASSASTGTAKSLRDDAAYICKRLGGVLGSTEEMRQNMNSVSASTEELATNMSSIAEAAQQSNTNVASIQTSIKELTTASSEIAENSARATAISKEAMQNVSAAFALVNELTQAAKDIDNVTSTISEISDQTKLLALNATIESARAGEMGKGFAVVAKEVKELASQTNSATKDIQGKIGIIHAVTKRTADAVAAINGVMKNVNDAITTIAAAAEEQSATTQNIGQNVVDATERIKHMTKNVSEGAIAVQDVSKSIVGATDHANQVASAIREVNEIGGKVQTLAVTAYAQALEVGSHGGDVLRTAKQAKLTAGKKEAAAESGQTLCRFSRDYDVGVERMNDDHKQIFDYINDLHAKIKTGTDPQVLLPIFREFGAFTREHFDREEEKLEEASYVDLPKQKAAHTKLLSQFSDIVKQIEAKADVDFIATLGFFREWLVLHILGMDKKYTPSMHAAGIH